MKRKYIYSALLTAMTLTGCTSDFEKINAPQDGVTEEQMNRDNFKTGAFYPRMQSLVVPADNTGFFQHFENLSGDVWGRMMMSNAKWKGGNLSEYTYQHTGWINNPFDILTAFYPSWKEIVQATNKEGVNYAYAVIFRVALMHRLTDLYGPIPYSKVETGNLYVPYDSQQTVYQELLKDLSEAINTLTSYHGSNPTATPMAGFDRVYDGDFAKWIKYANSLKLRIAMRMRNVEPTLARRYAEEAVNNSIGVITTNADNAAYKPVGSNTLWMIASAWGDCRVCADLTAYMNGYNDPRRKSYFEDATFDTPGINGIRSASQHTVDTYNKYSKVKVAQGDRMMWMSASEVAFLRAEGALLGWNMGGGSAKDYYEQGVRLSFDQWGAGSADNYLADGTSREADFTDPAGAESTPAVSDITIKWEDGDTQARKLERIITQKWIALWPLGFEGWCEYRRTGYPKFFPLASQVESKYGNLVVANRMPFSRKEYDNNLQNVQAAAGMLGGDDDFATKMWWQR